MELRRDADDEGKQMPKELSETSAVFGESQEEKTSSRTLAWFVMSKTSMTTFLSRDVSGDAEEREDGEDGREDNSVVWVDEAIPCERLEGDGR